MRAYGLRHICRCDVQCNFFYRQILGILKPQTRETASIKKSAFAIKTICVYYEIGTNQFSVNIVFAYMPVDTSIRIYIRDTRSWNDTKPKDGVDRYLQRRAMCECVCVFVCVCMAYTSTFSIRPHFSSRLKNPLTTTIIAPFECYVNARLGI